MKIYDFFGAHDEGAQKLLEIEGISLYEFAAKDWAALNSLGAYKPVEEACAEPSNAMALFDVAPLTSVANAKLGEMVKDEELLMSSQAKDLKANTVAELKQLLKFAAFFCKFQKTETFEWLDKELKSNLSNVAYFALKSVFDNLAAIDAKGYATKLLRVVRDAEEVFSERRNTWKDWIAEEHWSIDYLFVVDNIEDNLTFSGCGFWESELRLSTIVYSTVVAQRSLRGFFNVFGNGEMKDIPLKEYAESLKQKKAYKERLSNLKWQLRCTVSSLIEEGEYQNAIAAIESFITKHED